MIPQLTKTQKNQLILTIAIYGIITLTYTASILLNGTNYTHTWILENKLITAFYLIIPLGIIPTYEKQGKLRKKLLRQIDWVFLTIAIPSIALWIYFQYNQPTTGTQRLTETLASLLASATVISVFAGHITDKIKQ